MNRNSHAFTLIELLVIVAILAVLAALGVSALSEARGQADAASCRSNLSQIGQALALYTGDFGQYPGTRGAPILDPPGSLKGWGQIWDHRLWPYDSGHPAIFLCPSDPSPHTLPFFGLTNYTYGYNAYGTGIIPANLNLGLGRYQAPETDASLPLMKVTESQVNAPSDMLAVGDLTDHPSVFDTALRPNAIPPYAGAPAARHNGGANMVFCDGHTEFAQRQKWVEQTEAARRRWNNDHEPHPETW